MIDLQKEFRTLHLLASALIIIGLGMSLGGFGLALAMKDPALKSRTPSRNIRPEEPATPVAKSQSDANIVGESPMWRVQPDPTVLREKLSKSTGDLGMPGGLLGVLILGLGVTLRWIIRNNIDDGNELTRDNELFKAYAAQLVIAERLRAKNRKRLH